MEQTASPTGQPWFSPTVWKWVLLVFLVASAVLLVLSKSHSNVAWLTDARDIVVELGLVLGIASPGARRAAPALLLLVALPLALGGCALFQKPKVQAALEQCASSALTTEVQGVLPDVAKAITGGTVDWQPQLDAVMARGGAAAWCALVAILQGLEGGQGGSPGAMPAVLGLPGAGGPPRAVVLLRGYSYLEAQRR